MVTFFNQVQKSKEEGRLMMQKSRILTHSNRQYQR
jgi:hypothetical protein